ncbi:hypothetical protein CFR75_14675 [Komagataeibacter xylinus]|uniref:Uncharacterized protein n=1 Tax=Komagataeibacter xylinus TaxID=28448 RepID=A0A318PL50_KOMXY|nr:hypothetical protein [Komagataeibacter xylinus]PYD55756.1 hypothetical protein CFR75_14675 [Komagataeibacter xylinus]GBQ69077.1 hypothetical protein AA15237_0532 [Komagataeibacter xylinus NBRC 15237]
MNMPELNAALIENLPDIELTLRHVEALDAAVDTTLDAMTADWIKEHDWRGDTRGDEFWLAVPEWNDPSCADEDVVFYLQWTDFDSVDDSEITVISRLCQNGYGRAGLELCHNFKANKWNRILPELVELLQDTGFVLHEKQLILPFHVDRDVLVRGVADNDLVDGLRQFHETLDRLVASQPALAKVVARLRQELD